jgi:hypothetical protein
MRQSCDLVASVLAAYEVPMMYYQARMEDYIDWLDPWAPRISHTLQSPRRLD